MTKIGEAEEPRYFGLRRDVRFRVELGFAFVDDGDRVFKMQLGLFKQAIGTRPQQPLTSETVITLVRKHESVFDVFETKAQALNSLVDKEV